MKRTRGTLLALSRALARLHAKGFPPCVLFPHVFTLILSGRR